MAQENNLPAHSMPIQASEISLENLPNILNRLSDPKNAQIVQNYSISKALAELGEPAVEQFIQFIMANPKNFRAVPSIVLVLAQTNSTKAIQFLTASVTDANNPSSLRHAAISGLDWYITTKLEAKKQAELDNDPENPALHSPNNTTEINPSVINALQTVMENAKDFLSLPAAGALSKLGDAKAIAKLFETLNKPDASAKRIALVGISEIADERAVEPLLNVLNDPDPSIQQYAIRGLGKTKDSRAVEPLLGLLHESSLHSLHVPLMLALGQIGDKRATEPVLEFLANDDENLRKVAVLAVSVLGDKRAVEPLLSLLGEVSAEMRTEIIQGLMLLGDTRAVEALKPLLNDPDEQVRMTAKTALDSLGDPPAN